MAIRPRGQRRWVSGRFAAGVLRRTQSLIGVFALTATTAWVLGSPASAAVPSCMTSPITADSQALGRSVASMRERGATQLDVENKLRSWCMSKVGETTTPSANLPVLKVLLEGGQQTRPDAG
jgi:hypothetical protein